MVTGAKGVGLGRPILYGNSVWGKDGVTRVLDSKYQPTGDEKMYDFD